MTNTCECDKVKELLKQIEILKAQRDEARDLIGRAFELAWPTTHPEQWIGLRHIYSRAANRWDRVADSKRNTKCL